MTPDILNSINKLEAHGRRAAETQHSAKLRYLSMSTQLSGILSSGSLEKRLRLLDSWDNGEGRDCDCSLETWLRHEVCAIIRKDQ